MPRNVLLMLKTVVLLNIYCTAFPNEHNYVTRPLKWNTALVYLITNISIIYLEHMFSKTTKVSFLVM